MSFATAQDIVAARRLNNHLPLYDYTTRREVPVGPLRLADARQLLRSTLQATLSMQQSKVNRPWDIVNFSNRLNSMDSWIGWELELGFADEATYGRVINYMWRREPNTAIDREGDGRYAAELTFPPENMTEFAEEATGVWRLLKYFQKNNISLSNWSPGAMVGTHANISTPTFRKLSRRAAGRVVQAVNAALQALTTAQRVEFFGRNPYGWAFYQRSGESQWIEFKLFNSTGSIEEFRKYAKVAQRLAQVIDYISMLESFYESRISRLNAARPEMIAALNNLRGGPAFSTPAESACVGPIAPALRDGLTAETYRYGTTDNENFYYFPVCMFMQRESSEQRLRQQRASWAAFVNSHSFYVAGNEGVVAATTVN